MSDDLEIRYSRQIRVPKVGAEGQRRLLDSRVVIVGCGALGAALADNLARSGVGHLSLVDRDFIELSNLARQRLYTEQDIEDQLPKAIAASRRLAAVNSEIEIEPLVADLTARNIEETLAGADLVLDGTDNFVTRFLINEACHKLGLPWVYAGVVGTSGNTLSILPGTPPCFACFLPELPPPGSYDTCDTAGVLAPAVDIISALAALEGMKILLGRTDELVGRLSVVNCWTHQVTLLQLPPRAGCETCGGEYRWLTADLSSEAAVLCGRDSVQIPASKGVKPNLDELAARLAALGEVRASPYMLRFCAPECEITLFPDGRAILKGVDSKERARSLYARYLG